MSFNFTATVGNLVILQVISDGTGAQPTVSSINGIAALDGTASSLTQLTPAAEANVGNPAAAKQVLWAGRATSSAGAADVTVNASGDDCYAGWYEFTNVNTGTTIASILENGSAGSMPHGEGTGTTVSDVGVTTLGADRLACNFIAINDDNAIVAFTGETGGDWAIPLDGQAGSATGTDAQIGIQTAAMASAGTINGGTYTMASDAWGIIGFALIGTTAPVAYPFPPSRQLPTSLYLR